MKKIDTLFYFPKKAKPLQPIIEEFLKEEGKVKVSIMPGFVICPNLKQKFVPIEKKELFTCQVADGFYLVIDGNLDTKPPTINGVSIKKMPVPPEEEESAAGKVDPYYMLLAEVIADEEGEISLSYKTNFNLKGQVYFYLQTYETTVREQTVIEAFTRLL